MTTYKTKRLVGNPHHRSKKSRNKKRRRNMSIKQIRIFGSKAQKAALKRRLRGKRKATARKSHRARTRPSKANPKRRHSIPYAKNRRSKKSKAKKVAKRRSRNSALVFTLGSVNPRSTHMKKRKRKSSAGARRNRRRKNAHRRTVIRYVTHHRKHNTHRRRHRVSHARRNRHGHRRRSNPTLFGHHVTGIEMLMAIGGGLIGVTIAKLVPPMLPAQFTSNPYFRVAVVAGVAFAAGWAAQKVNPRFGDAVLFGGLMQAGSILLNVFLPQIGGAIGLSGLSELMPGAFSVPQNPLRLPAPPPVSPTQARIQVNGLQRAYGDAF